MPYRVTQEDILSLGVDAAAVSVEISLSISSFPVCRAVAEAGGAALSAAIRKARFIPVGSAVEVDPGSLPFRHLFAAAAPVWLTGKANEFLTLRLTYQNLFAAAEKAGCRSLALPFLSALHYRFPRDEAIKIAFSEAAKTELELVCELLEALYTASGDYALRQLKRLRPYLREKGIETVDYGPETAELFERLPSKQGTATLRPALLYGGKLLMAGRAAAPMD